MLKTIISLRFILACIVITGPAALYAQCGFESDINLSPPANNGVYCSYDTVRMSVVEPFDSFRWYYNFNGSSSGLMPIDGANGPALEIAVSDYGYAFFFVELTRDTCTELSEPVAIDSWVFAPVAVQHSPQSEYCRGDSTLISNAFGTYASYQWLRNYEPIEGATGPEYWVKESGTYVLNASPFECPELTLTSGIGPDFTFTGPQVPAITWDGNLLTASSGPDYQWALNGNPIAGANSSTYAPQEDGEYTVTVSDGSNCRPISAPVSIVVSDSREPGWARQFRFFPNPMGGALHFEAPQGATFELKLLDARGREVLSRQLLHTGAPAIPTGQLSPGVYLCQVSYQGETAIYRLVKP